MASTRITLTEQTLNEILHRLCAMRGVESAAVRRDWRGFLVSHFELTDEQHDAIAGLSPEGLLLIQATLRAALADDAQLVQVRLVRPAMWRRRPAGDVHVVRGRVVDGVFEPRMSADEALHEAIGGDLARRLTLAENVVLIIVTIGANEARRAAG